MTERHLVRLHGGPLDGQHKEISAFRPTEIPVECPWPVDNEWAAFHFAEARYGPDGRWMLTRCSSTDGEPLVNSPEETV